MELSERQIKRMHKDIKHKNIKSIRSVVYQVKEYMPNCDCYNINYVYYFSKDGLMEKYIDRGYWPRCKEYVFNKEGQVIQYYEYIQSINKQGDSVLNSMKSKCNNYTPYSRNCSGNIELFVNNDTIEKMLFYYDEEGYLIKYMDMEKKDKDNDTIVPEHIMEMKYNKKKYLKASKGYEFYKGDTVSWDRANCIFDNKTEKPIQKITTDSGLYGYYESLPLNRYLLKWKDEDTVHYNLQGEPIKSVNKKTKLIRDKEGKIHSEISILKRKWEQQKKMFYSEYYILYDNDTVLNMVKKSYYTVAKPLVEKPPYEGANSIIYHFYKPNNYGIEDQKDIGCAFAYYEIIQPEKSGRYNGYFGDQYEVALRKLKEILSDKRKDRMKIEYYK
jgi:hypothetical protein